MRRSFTSWIVVLCLMGTVVYAIAEDITLTTYYPSPRGVYDELRANRLCAIAGTPCLDLTGTSTFNNVTVNNNLTVNGNTTLGDGDGFVTLNADTITLHDTNGSGTITLGDGNDVLQVNASVTRVAGDLNVTGGNTWLNSATTTVNGSQFNVNSNQIRLGDAASDLISVNGTTFFTAPATFNSALTANGNAWFNAQVMTRGNTYLGDSGADSTVVSGTLFAQNDLSVRGSSWLGDSPGDSVVVPGTLWADNMVCIGGDCRTSWPTPRFFDAGVFTHRCCGGNAGPNRWDYAPPHVAGPQVEYCGLQQIEIGDGGNDDDPDWGCTVYRGNAGWGITVRADGGTANQRVYCRVWCVDL